MKPAWLFLLAATFCFVPAQMRSAAAQSRASVVPSRSDAATRGASKVQLERSSDACANLDEAECCAQMLEIAVFKATGDQLPKKTKGPVRLSCGQPEKVFPETSCRLIAMSRGFAAKDAAELCAPATLAKRCQGDSTCKQCVADLDRLAWKSSHRACYALTYVDRPSSDGTKVVSFTRGKPSASASIVRMRRTVLR